MTATTSGRYDGSPTSAKSPTVHEIITTKFMFANRQLPLKSVQTLELCAQNSNWQKRKILNYFVVNTAQTT